MKKVRCLIVLAIVVALCSCSISGVPEVIKTEGELLSHLGVKGVSEIYDLEVQQESTEEYDCTNICFKVREDYESFLEANYDKPEDGSDWVGKFEPDEVSKNIFESRIKDISFDDVLNCGTLFKRYSVRLKGDIGKSETSLSTDWYRIDGKDGEYLLIVASVPQLLDVQIETEAFPEANIEKKRTKSTDQLLSLIGFNEGFEIYDIRYLQNSDDKYGSTTICFKTDVDYTEVVKKHCGYYEDYFDSDASADISEVDRVFFNNIQGDLPENEQIPFDFVMKCGVLFQGYTVKESDNRESATTNSTNWYLINDGEKEYLWIVNIIPEIIDIKIDGAVLVD